MFMPIPIIQAGLSDPSASSHSIPANFPFSIYRSLGHFILIEGGPAQRDLVRMDCMAADEAMAQVRGSQASRIPGLGTAIDRYRPVPGGEIQFRPFLPLPLVWEPATKQRHRIPLF